MISYEECILGVNKKQLSDLSDELSALNENTLSMMSTKDIFLCVRNMALLNGSTVKGYGYKSDADHAWNCTVYEIKNWLVPLLAKILNDRCEDIGYIPGEECFYFRDPSDGIQYSFHMHHFFIDRILPNIVWNNQNPEFDGVKKSWTMDHSTYLIAKQAAYDRAVRNYQDKLHYYDELGNSIKTVLKNGMRRKTFFGSNSDKILIFGIVDSLIDKFKSRLRIDFENVFEPVTCFHSVSKLFFDSYIQSENRDWIEYRINRLVNIDLRSKNVRIYQPVSYVKDLDDCY